MGSGPLPLLLRLAHPFLHSLRRRHLAFGVAGLLLGAGGLLGYALVYPELAFAQTPTKLARELHAGDVTKVFGKIACNCTVAVDREEFQVGFAGRSWNATYATFWIQDPSGQIYVDTDAITRLQPGLHGGDYMPGDNASVYGAVYDEGNGLLALRAQMMAKGPQDTAAAQAFWFGLAGAMGALLFAAAVTDRLLFGQST